MRPLINKNQPPGRGSTHKKSQEEIFSHAQKIVAVLLIEKFKRLGRMKILVDVDQRHLVLGPRKTSEGNFSYAANQLN